MSLGARNPGGHWPPRSRWLRRSVLAAALIAATQASGQFLSIPLGGPPKVKPSPNATQLGAPADVAGSLAVPDRPSAMSALDAAIHPAEVLAFLGLSRGGRVLVVEANPGYYGEIIGAAIGEGGRVTVPVPAAQLRDPARRTAFSDLLARAPNVSLVADNATRFAPGSFDFVLLDRVDHDVRAGSTDRAVGWAGKLFAAVKPDGIVGVVGDTSDPGGEVQTSGVGRLDAAAVKNDFRRAGFVLDNETTLARIAGDNRSAPMAIASGSHGGGFVLRFRKPE